jgi:hypothetical protein
MAEITGDFASFVERGVLLVDVCSLGMHLRNRQIKHAGQPSIQFDGFLFAEHEVSEKHSCTGSED